MADEQGVTTSTPDRADGEFARKVTGKDVKGDITAVGNLLVNVGADGRGFNALENPPSNPDLGDVYLADGTNWDPDADGAGPELVAYDSSGAWVEIVQL